MNEEETSGGASGSSSPKRPRMDGSQRRLRRLTGAFQRISRNQFLTTIVATVIAGVVVAVLTRSDSPHLTQAAHSPPPVHLTEASPPAAAGADRRVWICDVVYDPPGNEPDDEEISLCNDGSETRDLSGWEIRDNHGRYVIPAGTRLAPKARWTVRGATLNPTRWSGNVWLNNESDRVALLDGDGNEVDRRSW